jgi:Flp pilus assembly protein TadD
VDGHPGNLIMRGGRMPEQPLRIFVAMPGKEMGPNASYAKPESVKANLLDPVAEKLEAALGRKVEIVIEKDKTTVGRIHESMFGEARDAEVYIADLTGANPNVYLELGVRWALRDCVTVPICQSAEELKFNVTANRAIIYEPNKIVKATNDVTHAILHGLTNKKSDSPVRADSEFVEIARKDLEGLNARIKQLEQERGEELIRLAKSTDDTTQRIKLLRRAIDVNPGSTEALLALGIALRGTGDYPEAIEHLEKATRLDPDNAVAYRELGVTYSKKDELTPAVSVLRRSVELDPRDAEAWSNLGGALRRVGMEGAKRGQYDNKALSESRDSYAEAHRLKEYDLYPALNVARLDILLSRWDPDRFAQGRAEFTNEVDLCRHEVRKNPADWWRRFDLADALLFSGETAEARTTYDAAIKLVTNDQRKDVLSTVLGPMRDLITAQVLKGDLLAEVEHIITTMEDAIRDGGGSEGMDSAVSS